MWNVAYGDEWSESWAVVEAELHRPDRVLGAVTFAMQHDPLKYSQGVAESRDSLRVFTTTDHYAGREVWVFLHASQMLRTVTLQWAKVATDFDPDA